jgi:hypothetical protein
VGVTARWQSDDIQAGQKKPMDKNTMRTTLMTLKAIAAAAVLAAGTLLTASAASAGPLPSLDLLRSQAADQSAVEHVVGPYGPCVWGRARGWHRNGRYGTWRSC